jgi:hypothetical protein
MQTAEQQFNESHYKNNFEKHLEDKLQHPTFAPTSRSRAAVARRAHNPKVAGSIPAFATEIKALQKKCKAFSFWLNT